MDHPLTLPMELSEGVTAQIDEARHRLENDAAAAGISRKLVDDAVADAVEAYRGAHVHAFIGILVERQVRGLLGLRSRYRQSEERST
jgi:hypothetical protein